MSKNRVSSASADAAPLIHDVTQSMAGFVEDFRGFRDDIKAKLKLTEERVIMLDRKTQIAARPQLSATNDAGAPHQKAFMAYLRSGEDDGLRGLQLDGKSLSSAVNSDGGYLVDPVTSETVTSVLQATASIRSIAAVVTVEATSYDVLVDHTDVGAG